MTSSLLVCALGGLLALPAALRLRRRGLPYWAATLILLATLGFAVAGLVRPWILIQPVSLSFAVLCVAALATATVMLLLALLDRQPQKALRVLHALATGVAAWGTSDLILSAWASV